MFKKKFYNSTSDNQHSTNNSSHRRYFRRPRVTSSSAGVSCDVMCHSHRGGNYIFSEFLCHLPMAIFSLSICILLFVFINGIISQLSSFMNPKIIYSDFFHISHYIHILCASYASFYFFGRNSDIYSVKKNVGYALVSFLNATLFCTLADIILPSLGGLILGQNIPLHLCFFCFHDFLNIVLFSLFGILASLILLLGSKEYANGIAKRVHIFHVWFGALSALLYIASQIEFDPSHNSGFLFILLFFSVVIPCIFSDIVIPFIVENIFFHNNKDYTNKRINY